MYPSLNIINGKYSPHVSKVILGQYNYEYIPKLGLGIVEIRRIPCSFHDFTTILPLSLDSKTKEESNKPIYGRVYYYNYFCFVFTHKCLSLIYNL